MKGSAMHSNLSITLLSDACFSMPTSRDTSVDTNIATDSLGLPTIPGKTLHGLLRDTWLAAQPKIDPDKIGLSLLGLEKRHEEYSILRIGDARISLDDRSLVKHSLSRSANPFAAEWLTDAFSEVRTVTAEDRLTGGPKQETLRVYRVAPRGTVLLASLESSRELSTAELTLLEQLVALSRHGGLSRNRGLGHVRMEINRVVDVKELVNSVALHENFASEVQFLSVDILLKEPCLIKAKDLDPNSHSTRSYIPGSALRGAVAAVLVRSGADEAVLTEVLTSGKVRFLNGYPVEEGLRSLPTPNTWTRVKDPLLEDHMADPQDQALALLARFPEDRVGQPDRQRQPLKGKFYAGDGRGFTAVQPKIRSATHQQRVRKTAVTSKNAGTVFVYEALESEQAFRALVALPPGRQDLVDRVVEALTGGPIWLGRSAKSGYGGSPSVEVKLLGEGSSETRHAVLEISAGDSFIVRLTSDAVLRCPVTGSHDPWRLGDSLASRFYGKADVVSSAVTADTVTGYSRLWRTELPRVHAAAAGSTVLLTATQNMAPVDLIRLAADPLGERVAEGFGCFVILSAIDEPALNLLTPASERKLNAEPAVRPSESLLRAQRRIYNKRLRSLLSVRAMDLASGARRLPAAHLINRLRVPLRSSEWKETYRTWLEERGQNALRTTQTDALKKLQFGGTTFLNWLKTQIEDDVDLLKGIDGIGGVRQNYRLLPQTDADAVWSALMPTLHVYFMETVLSSLAMKANKEKTDGN